jgi:hypothetical protein
MNLLLLLLAGWVSMTISCHKPDFPHNKLCQLTMLIDSTNIYGREYRYLYNQHRLLDSLVARATFNPIPAVTLKMGYDNQKRPLTFRDNYNNMHKYVYQAGRIIRVDGLGTDNQYHTLYTYTYDNRGRVVSRISGSEVLRWEYDGPSNNFKRRLSFPPSDLTTPTLIYEYTYDNKLNPWNTWPNTTLFPFYFPLLEINTVQYEPITQNNVVRETVKGNVGDGTYFMFRESIFAYQYDDIYPVKRTARYLSYFVAGGSQETPGVSHYYYDCKDDIH